MNRPYTVVNGAYNFPGESCQLQLRKVQRDRYGHLYADVDIITLDGVGYLASDHGDLGSGRFRKEVATQASRWNSGNPDAYESLIMAAFIALRSDSDVVELTPSPAFVRAQEFMERVPAPAEAVVSGLIERGNLYAVGAKPKTGKTLLMLQLGLAVAQGTNWLGRMTAQGRVLMFQLEDSERTLRRRMEAMAPAVPPDLWFHITPFKLVSENYDATARACQGASLIVCDPIIQASEVRDWNAQQEVRDVYDRWRRLARDTGAAVVVTMHHRKMDGDFGDQLAGSIQAQATVDGIIEMYRDRSLDRTDRRMTFVGRDWADMEEEVVSLDTDTLTWQAQGKFAEAKAEARHAKVQARANETLDALPTKPPGMTYQEWQAATGCQRRQLQNLRKVLGEKVLSNDGPYSSTNPMRFWRVL